MTLDLGAAVETLHNMGVVHGALRPRNVMMLEDGRVKLMDVELAGLRDAWEIQGVITAEPAEYLSLEQIRRAPVTEKTDIYAYGAISTRCVLGRRRSRRPQIYGKGNDLYVFLGHDRDIHYGYIYRLAGQPWSSYTVLSANTADGSASIRWDPQRDNNPAIIDTAYFDEDKLRNQSYLPELFYMAIVPTAGSTPPSAPTSLRVQ